MLNISSKNVVDFIHIINILFGVLQNFVNSFWVVLWKIWLFIIKKIVQSKLN